jgi:hypothetical protein
MKTCSLYGFILAISSAFLTLVLYFLGFHSDPAKLGMGRGIGSACILVIGISCTALGVKARRSEVPASEPFGYGSALWAGIVISFVAGVLGAIFNYIYVAYINTEYSDVMLQFQMDKLQAKGMTGAQLEQAEKFTRFFMSPLPLAFSGMVIGLFFGFLISLVVAAFLKRPEPAAPPVTA